MKSPKRKAIGVLAGVIALQIFTSCTAPGRFRANGGSAPRSAGLTRHINVAVGFTDLDESDWAPLGEQNSYGLEFVTLWPNRIGVELGVRYATANDDSAGFWDTLLLGPAALIGNGALLEDAFNFNGNASFDQATFHEFYVGARKEWPTASATHFLGAGLAGIMGELDVERSGTLGSLRDEVLAGYVHAGARWPIHEAFHIGLDARLLLGPDFDFDGLQLDSDYGQLVAFIGFAF